MLKELMPIFFCLTLFNPNQLLNTNYTNDSNVNDDCILTISEQDSLYKFMESTLSRSGDENDYYLKNISYPTIDGEENPNFDREFCNPNDFPRNYSDSEYTNPQIQSSNYKKIYDLSSIHRGDIILEAKGAGHAAIVYDTNKVCKWEENGQIKEFSFIQTIEALNNKGVVFGFLDSKRIFDHNVYILRPNTLLENAINSALYFCYNQLGKPYNFPIDSGRVNVSEDSISWYCTELINAAFYSYMPSYAIGGISENGWIFPRQWLYLNKLKHKIIDNMPTIIPIEKLSNGWKFLVYNNSSESINIFYNSKMCFRPAGIEWNSNLRNITSSSVNSSSYININIQSNYFATCCTFSMTTPEKRDITLFHDLYEGFGTFEMERNIV